MTNRSRAFFWLLGGLILLLAALILTDLVPLLRGPAPETPEWYWTYRLRPVTRWWPAVLAAFGLAGLASWWLRREDGPRATAVFLAGWIVLHLVLQLAIMAADPDGWQAEPLTRTLSILNNGYFQPAVETADLPTLLATYPERMPTFESEHVRTHPPGLVVLNWLLLRLMERWPALADRLAAAVWPQRCADLWLLDRPAAVAAALALSAYLPMIAGALVILPAFAAARRLLAPAAVRPATLLAGSIPALFLFSPNADQLFATLGLVALVFLLRGREAGQWAPAWYFAAGLLAGGLTFLSLGVAPLLLPLAGLVVFSCDARDEAPTRRTPLSAAAGLIALGVGVAFPWLLYWVAWGVPPWAIAGVGLSQHYELVTLQRRYGWWVVWNLVDLVIFLGLPAAIGFLLALPAAVRDWPRSKAVLALLTALLVVALDLSGSARGEVGRLWLFMMPFLALPAGETLAARLPGGQGRLLPIAGQLLLAVALGVAWVPVEESVVVASRPAMPVEPADLVSVGQLFGRHMTLVGFSLAKEPDALQLTLIWEASGPALRPYTVFNHLLDPSGQIVAQHDGWPADGAWPPTCWRAGERVVDAHRLPLPDNLEAGRYSLVTGLYDARDLSRVPAAGGETAVELVQINLR